MSTGRTRASSSAKNGFPPDRSWIRSNVWRANDLSQPIAQEPMERARAERPHDHLPDAVRTQRALELRLLRALDQPPCEQKADRARVEPPQGERERARRGRVEPLNVVDGDQNRPTFAQKLQRVAHCNRERAAIDGIT